ncbi:unnamed protein product [Ectocarpus sp. 8 AP-2014]
MGSKHTAAYQVQTWLRLGATQCMTIGTASTPLSPPS